MSKSKHLPIDVLNDAVFRCFLHDEIRSAYGNGFGKIRFKSEKIPETEYIDRENKPLIVNYIGIQYSKQENAPPIALETIYNRLSPTQRNAFGHAKQIPSIVIQIVVNFLSDPNHGTDGFEQRCQEEVAKSLARTSLQRDADQSLGAPLDEVFAAPNEKLKDPGAQGVLADQRKQKERGTRGFGGSSFRGIAAWVWIAAACSLAGVIFTLYSGFAVLRGDLSQIGERIVNETRVEPRSPSLDIRFGQTFYREDNWIEVVARMSELAPTGDTAVIEVLEDHGDKTARVLLSREVRIKRDKGGAYIETTMPDLPGSLLLCIRYKAMTEDAGEVAVRAFVVLQEVLFESMDQIGHSQEQGRYFGAQEDVLGQTCAGLWGVSVVQNDSEQNDKQDQLRQLEQRHSYARMRTVTLARYKDNEIRFGVNDYGKFAAPAQKTFKRFDLYAFGRDPQGEWAEIASFRTQKIAGTTVQLKTIAPIPEDILTCTITQVEPGVNVVQTATVRRLGLPGTYSFSALFNEEREIRKNKNFCQTLGHFTKKSQRPPKKQLIIPQNTKASFGTGPQDTVSVLGVTPGDDWQGAGYTVSFAIPGALVFETPDDFAWRLKAFGIDKLLGFVDLQNHRSAIIARRAGKQTVAAIWYRYKPKESDLTATSFQTQLDKEFGKDAVYSSQLFSSSVEARYSDVRSRLGDNANLCYNFQATLASDVWPQDVGGLSPNTVKRFLGGLKFAYPDHQMNGDELCGSSLAIKAINLGRFPFVEYILTDHALLAGANNPNDRYSVSK